MTYRTHEAATLPDVTANSPAKERARPEWTQQGQSAVRGVTSSDLILTILLRQCLTLMDRRDPAFRLRFEALYRQDEAYVAMQLLAAKVFGLRMHEAIMLRRSVRNLEDAILVDSGRGAFPVERKLQGPDELVVMHAIDQFLRVRKGQPFASLNNPAMSIEDNIARFYKLTVVGLTKSPSRQDMAA